MKSHVFRCSKSALVRVKSLHSHAAFHWASEVDPKALVLMLVLSLVSEGFFAELTDELEPIDEVP